MKVMVYKKKSAKREKSKDWESEIKMLD